MHNKQLTTSRQARVIKTLEDTFNLTYLVVENESHRHQVPEGAELHFKIIAVSEAFSGLTLIARHRLINQSLKQEFNTGMHALSLHLYTPDEWIKRSEKTLNSPECARSDTK